MKKRISIQLLVAVVVGACAPVFGGLDPHLFSIGVLDPTSGTTAYSSIQAISDDGSYVVGTSQAPGGAIRVPVVWSQSDGLVALPNPSGANSIGIGVAVGVGGNAGNILIAGLHEGNLTQRYYKAPLNNLASGSWVDVALAGGLGTVSNMRGGMYNDLRNAAVVNGWPPSGNFYTAGKRADTGRDARLRADLNMSGWDGTGVNNVSSVSAYGALVGRSSASPSGAYYDIPNVQFATVPGSSGVRADGFGISSLFGSTTDPNSKQWISGWVNNFNGSYQAFRWARGDATMTFLGALPGDTLSCAYTTSDSGVTAGNSWVTGRGYLACVWDTSGIWDTTGQAKDLKALLTADGVDTSMWSSLNRVYAASEDGSRLAGYGTWAADGSTRGFLATIPEPGSLALLALGGTLVLLRRKGVI